MSEPTNRRSAQLGAPLRAATLSYEMASLSYEMDALSHEMDALSHEMDALSHEMDALSRRSGESSCVEHHLPLARVSTMETVELNVRVSSQANIHDAMAK